MCEKERGNKSLVLHIALMERKRDPAEFHGEPCDIPRRGPAFSFFLAAISSAEYRAML